MSKLAVIAALGVLISMAVLPSFRTWVYAVGGFCVSGFVALVGSTGIGSSRPLTRLLTILGATTIGSQLLLFISGWWDSDESNVDDEDSTASAESESNKNRGKDPLRVVVQKQMREGFGVDDVWFIGMVIVVASLPFSFAGEVFDHSASRAAGEVAAKLGWWMGPAFRAVSILFFGVAAPLTHGMTARWRHNAGWLDSYSFYQPFAGGTMFVVLQGIGWTVYAASALMALAGLVLPPSYTESYAVGLSSGGSIGGVLAELLVGGSVFFYEESEKEVALSRSRSGSASASPRRSRSASRGRLSRPSEGALSPTELAAALAAAQARSPLEAATDKLRAMAYNTKSLLLVTSLYSVHWVYFFSGVLILVFYGGEGATWLLLVHAVYGVTYVHPKYRNAPQTASRRWAAVRDNVDLWDTFKHYFSGELIPAADLSEKQQYLFAFHPHGIYPGSALWGLACSQWREAYGDIQPDVMVASALFRLPILRDIGMWFGFKVASRENVGACLAAGRSIMLVPGGQAEMRVNRSIHEAEQKVITRHKGFLRFALRYGVPLVPMYSFGETSVLDDIYMPATQAWFVKHIGAHFPHLPFGRWGLPLVPRPARVTVVVGPPVAVKLVEEPTAEDIEELRTRYFAALQTVFDKHKAAAGYPDWNLNLLEKST